MDYQLVRFKIDDLNDFVRSGLLALPDFQRDFVWGPQKVVDLMQSVAREWPIGSLLLLEGPADFACKALDQAPPVRNGSAKYLLLDGQQRITSIFHAIRDISDHVYYIDINILVNQSLDDDFVFYMRRKAFENKFPTIQHRARAGLIKIAELYETEAFFEWLQFLESNEVRKAAVKVRRNYIYGLNSGVYSVPATVLPNGISFDALAKIFEGLNTNAVRLTTSDLLVAANLPKKVNLRLLWSEYQSKDPNVDALDLELLDILKICALREKFSGNDKIRGIKQTDLVKVDAKIYQRQWDASCAQLTEAISFASKYFGIKGSRLLPSSYNLLALSFALQANWPKKRLVEWWISLIVDETFAQSAHTRMLTEVSRIKGQMPVEKWAADYEKMQLTMNAAISKPHAANAYLARGILSLRVAYSKINNIDGLEPYDVGDRIKIVSTSGMQPPTKDTSIDDLRAILSSKKRENQFLTNGDDIGYEDVVFLIHELAGKIKA